ncbi:hypothetical protein R1sor_024213 [Riccia sorocarpa]|uniref:F-box domain-containing protein n=1 Tax=Riccia sorocarpa TaxID=122646 RepID=A0ABD3GPW0_9MARC
MSRQALSQVCRSIEQETESRTFKELVLMWVWFTLIVLSRILDRLLQHVVVLIRKGEEIDGGVNEIDIFADCWDFGGSGSEEGSSGEALEVSHGRQDANGNLIPGLPDDLVVVLIWPRIASSVGDLRAVNKEWRSFVTTTSEWLAMEVVRLSEGLNRRGYAVFRDALADRVEVERVAILQFLRELNREEMFGVISPLGRGQPTGQ